MGIGPQLNEDLVKDALDNLFFVDSEPQARVKLPPSLAQEFPCEKNDSLAVENHID